MSDRDKAIDLIKATMHGTRADGKTPAWQHPLDVAEGVKQLFEETEPHKDADAMELVAILHDVLEDGVKENGKRVAKADILMELSPIGRSLLEPIGRLTKADDCHFGTPQLIEYFSHILRADDTTKIVKCIDRVVNLGDAKTAFNKYRLERYQYETKMFVIPIARTIPAPWGPWIEKKLVQLAVTESEVEVRRKKKKDNNILVQKYGKKKDGHTIMKQ